MDEVPEKDGFVYCWGSGLALHREGGELALQLGGDRQRHALTFEQAERIRDDIDRALRDARRVQREQQAQASDGRGGERRGDS